MRLNLGCGDHYADGWVNVDAWGGVRADVFAQLDALPFDDGAAEMVYAGHVLEHIHPDVIPAVLGEIRRVLAADGRFCAVGPDCDRIDRVIDPRLWHDAAFGGHRWPGDEHRWLCTETGLLGYVRVTFPDAQPVLVADVPAGWPIVARGEAWQCAVIA